MKNYQNQADRMLNEFMACPNTEISSVALHRIGSGKQNGFLASFGRRISDLRKRGYDIRCSDIWVKGQRHTFYKLVPNEF